MTANRSWRIFNQQLLEVTVPRRTKSGVEAAWQRLIDGKAATNLAAVDFRKRTCWEWDDKMGPSESGWHRRAQASAKIAEIKSAAHNLVRGSTFSLLKLFLFLG